jgi:hypothetical protein
MAPRLSLSHNPLSPTEEDNWLEWLKNQNDDRLTMKQMLRIQAIIDRLELPCQFTTEAGTSLLRIYARNANANPPHARPVPLLTLRESQVPRGEQHHPRLGTLGRAWITRIALNGMNEARCNAIGINPGTLRPGSIHPTR